MQRAKTEEVVEVHLGTVGAAVFWNPAPADRELMVAKHVHHADCGKRHAGQIRTLCHGGTHKESAVGSAGDGQAVVGRVSFCDQVFPRGDEVVKYVLLLEQHAALVPILAEFTTTAQVGHGINAALLEQDNVGRGEARGQRDVESAVGIKHGGAVAVEFQARLVDDEHGHHCAVLGGVEDLLALVSGRVEVDLGDVERRALACGHVVAEDARGVGERGEGVEELCGVLLAAEAARGASGVGQGDLAGVCAVRVAARHGVAGVLEVGGKELTARRAHAFEQMLRLGDDVGPGAAVRRVGRVDRDEAVLRRVDVGHHEQPSVHVVHDARAGVEAVHDHLPIRVGIGEVLNVEVVAVRAGGGIEDEEAVVLGGIGEVVTVGLVVVPEDQFVLALGRAQLVEVHAVEGVLGTELRAIRSRVPAIIEAVAHPARAGELDPFQHVARFFARCQVHDADLLPIAAGRIAHHHDVLVVIGGAGEAGGDGAVLAQGVGVEEDFVFAIEALADIPDALVLKSVVFADVVAVANLPRRTDLLVVEDLLIAVADGVAEGNSVQVLTGHRILGLYPCAGLFAAVVFEPAISIVDLGSEIGVHHLLGAGVRVVEGFHQIRLRGSATGGQEERKGGGENQISHVVNRVAN